jgi:CheY-like chemotaxis protein
MRATPLSNLHILVVDDDELVLHSVARLLRVLGAQVDVAGRLDSALGSVATAAIDVALVDLNLGRTNGLTVARALKAVNPKLPTILMTGEACRSQAGVEGFLRKPFSVAQLVDAVQAVTPRLRLVVGGR